MTQSLLPDFLSETKRFIWKSSRELFDNEMCVFYLYLDDYWNNTLFGMHPYGPKLLRRLQISVRPRQQQDLLINQSWDPFTKDINVDSLFKAKQIFLVLDDMHQLLGSGKVNIRMRLNNFNDKIKIGFSLACLQLFQGRFKMIFIERTFWGKLA